MENASKALLMAAGVLITILIVSLIIFARNRASDFYNSDDAIDDTSDVTKFNLQFTNYERNDVKGVELISLSNKIADYNFRHSNAEGAKNDEGYQFITLIVDIGASNSAADPFKYGDNSVLFGNQTVFTQSGVSNAFSNINSEMYRAENTYGKKNLRNLAKAIYVVFPNKSVEDITDFDKLSSVKKFKEITSSKDVGLETYKTLYDNVKNCDLNDTAKVITQFNTIQTIFKDVSLKYYEYTQFKKGIFKYKENSTRYAENGRIISMEFDFTGKVE